MLTKLLTHPSLAAPLSLDGGQYVLDETQLRPRDAHAQGIHQGTAHPTCTQGGESVKPPALVGEDGIRDAAHVAPSLRGVFNGRGEGERYVRCEDVDKAPERSDEERRRDAAVADCASGLAHDKQA